MDPFHNEPFLSVLIEYNMSVQQQSKEQSILDKIETFEDALKLKQPILVDRKFANSYERNPDFYYVWTEKDGHEYYREYTKKCVLKNIFKVPIIKCYYPLDD